MQPISQHDRYLFLFGTRPEAIKLCPVFLAMQKAGIPYLAINTGQHRDMVADVLAFFGCRADWDLAVMQPNQTPLSLTQALLARLPEVYRACCPRAVIVHGDTATAFAGMLSAYLSGIPVLHIEAGLRTGDVHAPFPEEFHRIAIDAASEVLFAPTQSSADTLLREGHAPDRICLCGNTSTDAVRLALADDRWQIEQSWAAVRLLSGEGVSEAAWRDKRLLLLTAHRRELSEERLTALLRSIRTELERHPDAVLLFPVHPAPRVRRAAHTAFTGCTQALLCEPIALPHMQRLLSVATLLLTDSGGLQEEAVYLGIPTLVLRERTERPEGVLSGALLPLGCDGAKVSAKMHTLLQNEAQRSAMARPEFVFGDGHAAERIVLRLAQK